MFCIFYAGTKQTFLTDSLGHFSLGKTVAADSRYPISVEICMELFPDQHFCAALGCWVLQGWLHAKCVASFIWNVLVSVHSVSLLCMSIIHSLPVCEISPLSVQNPAQEAFCFILAFSQTLIDHSCDKRLCVCLRVYVHEWCVLAHWVLFYQELCIL